MKLLQSLFVTYAVVQAQELDQNETQVSQAEFDNEDFGPDYHNPYVHSDYELGDYADDEVEDISRSRNSRMSVVTFDMNWRSYDERSKMVFDTLFPGVMEQDEFQTNEDIIQQQDDEICRLGHDPTFPDIKVKCDRTRSNPRPKIKYMTPARKFKQLKMLVLWLQESQEFGRYCYYGCHCMPEGSHNLLGNGYGVPVDSIDRSCKNFFQCYECAKMEDSTCQGDKVKYKYRLVQDQTTGEKKVECVNKEGSCQRNICECDKRWSEKLAQIEGDFDPRYHKNRGVGIEPAWKYNNECKKSKGIFGKPEECCGASFPDKMPLQKGKQCCGYRPFDPNGPRQCCAGDKLRETCDA